MQNKGLFRVLAILIALACLYQISFTWATRNQEKKAAVYAEKAAEAEKVKPEFAKVSNLDQAYYLDSVIKVKNRYYLDSVADKKVARTTSNKTILLIIYSIQKLYTIFTLSCRFERELPVHAWKEPGSFTIRGIFCFLSLNLCFGYTSFLI